MGSFNDESFSASAFSNTAFSLGTFVPPVDDRPIVREVTTEIDRDIVRPI